MPDNATPKSEFVIAIDAVVTWHKGLFPNSQGHGGDRASRARLRRCENLLDLLLEPSVHELLIATRLGKGQHPPLLVLAAVLAQVEPNPNSTPSFASLLGAGGPDNCLMKPQRFQALLRAMTDAGDDTEVFALRLRALRRAVKLAGGSFNIQNFVHDVLFFNEATARNWSYDYWQTPMHFKPSTDAASTETGSAEAAA